MLMEYIADIPSGWKRNDGFIGGAEGSAVDAFFDPRGGHISVYENDDGTYIVELRRSEENLATYVVEEEESVPRGYVANRVRKYARKWDNDYEEHHIDFGEED